MTRFRTLETSNPALTPDGFDFVTVKSPALGHRADLTLFAPRQAHGRRGLPLVLLLHGVYGSHWSWAFQGGAHRTLQMLVDRGAVPPMLLAMPSDGLRGDGSGYVPHADADFERWIVDEVPAAARQLRPELDDTSPLALIGLSMGGFAALRLAARDPQRWCAAAGHSSITEAAQLDALVEESRAGWSPAPEAGSVLGAVDAALSAGAALPPLYLDCGLDDPLLPANRDLHAALRDRGVVHAWREYPGGHDWPYWQTHLADSLAFVANAIGARAKTCA
ncbi:MAG: esterase [Xanthomonadaceae bacterium]|nr:esterase [Xanthomonadaceae bacterium]